MKQEGPDHMLRAIRQVLNGQIYLSARMSPRILDVLAGRGKNARSPIGRLTDREFEVLQLIGQGKDSHAIAKELHVSFKTVDNHRARLKEKLKLQSGTELICYAARWIEAQQLSRS
jgi:DNA-binding NarL/FixJ family response regulator